MTSVPHDPPTADLGDFAVEPEGVRRLRPVRRPRGVTVAGVLMLLFAALLVAQLVLPWTSLVRNVRMPMSSLRLLSIHWDPLLIGFAVLVTALAVPVLLGSPRIRFAALAVMGALAVQQVLRLAIDVVGTVSAGFDRPIEIIATEVSPANVLGLVVAGTAFGSLAVPAVEDWFGVRQSARRRPSSNSPAPGAVSPTAATDRSAVVPPRPLGLRLGIVGLLLIVLYGLGLFLFRFITVDGDGYGTRGYYQVHYLVSDLPTVLILLTAVITVGLGRSTGRCWAFAAAGSYCYLFVARVGQLPYFSQYGLDFSSEDQILIGLSALASAVAVTALILLSHNDVTAWFRQRRETRLSPEPSG